MIKIPEYVQNVLQTLEDAGFEAWCVGGCVRDALLGKEPDDWDVTTNALPEETIAIFGEDAIPTGLKHGTVTIRSMGDRVEVTTYRIDGVYLDHRRPQSVSFTRSLTEDLARRDFTMNAIAMDQRGELQDPFGGRADLEDNLIRCVGEPDKRFEEDALRIMRGLRFAAVLGFAIDPDTASAMKRHRLELQQIAVERIQVELMKLLVGKNAAEILRRYMKIIGVILPELLPMIGFDQHTSYHCYDVWEHTLHALDATPPDPLLRFVVLLHDSGKPFCFSCDAYGQGHFYGHALVSQEIAETIMERLRFDNAFAETASLLVVEHDRIVIETKRSVRRTLRRIGVDNMRKLLAVKRADNLGRAEKFHSRVESMNKIEELLQEVLDEDACFTLKQMAVNGRDIMSLGISGPDVGRALDALLSMVVDGDVPNDHDALMEAARKFIRPQKRKYTKRK